MMPWTSSVHYQRRVGYVMYQQGWYRERQPRPLPGGGFFH